MSRKYRAPQAPALTIEIWWSIECRYFRRLTPHDGASWYLCTTDAGKQGL